MDGQDWRLQGQEPYLQGATLHKAPYSPASQSNDHDHCESCQGKFTVHGNDDSLSEGYCTPDGGRWVCPTCFDDFHERFNFQVVS